MPETMRSQVAAVAPQLEQAIATMATVQAQIQAQMKTPEFQRTMTQVVQAIESRRAVEISATHLLPPLPPTLYRPAVMVDWQPRSPRRRPGFAPWSDEDR